MSARAIWHPWFSRPSIRPIDVVDIGRVTLRAVMILIINLKIHSTINLEVAGN
jgi:hypothetical protein